MAPLLVAGSPPSYSRRPTAKTRVHLNHRFEGFPSLMVSLASRLSARKKCRRRDPSKGLYHTSHVVNIASLPTCWTHRLMPPSLFGPTYSTRCVSLAGSVDGTGPARIMGLFTHHPGTSSVYCRVAWQRRRSTIPCASSPIVYLALHPFYPSPIHLSATPRGPLPRFPPWNFLPCEVHSLHGRPPSGLWSGAVCCPQAEGFASDAQRHLSRTCYS